MAPKVKEAMGMMSAAIETACGWAFVAVALYSLMFVNMTGNGTLWDSLRGIVMEAAGMPPAAKNVTVQTRVVPVRPADKVSQAQDRMLQVPNEPDKEFSVPVIAQVEDTRAAEQITDAPADAKAGKDWRKHLNGSLRTFTVYGNGEQHSSASTGGSAAAPARAAASAHASAPAATPATVASAYHAGAAAIARPGISDHVSSVDSGAGDGVRNFR